MMMINSGLDIWVIYDHPDDFPTQFVLRRHVVTIDGATYATGEAYGCDSLEPLRWHVREDLGLTCLTRTEHDDPNILETWV